MASEVSANPKAWVMLADRVVSSQFQEISYAEKVVLEEIDKLRLEKTLDRAKAAQARQRELERHLAEGNDMIKNLEEGMKRAQEVTDKALLILSQLDGRLERIKDKIEPVHDITASLTHTDRNLQKTLALIDTYLAYFQTASRVRSTIRERKPDKERYKTHIDYISQLDDGIAFFGNADYVGGPERMKEMRGLLAKALADVDEMAAHEIRLASTPKELRHWEADRDTPGLLQPQDLALFTTVAPVLIAHGCPLFLKEYRECRRKFLEESFKRAKTAILANSKVKNDRLPREWYQKGSHGFMRVLTVALQMFRLERELAIRLLDSKTFDSTYAHIIGAAVSLLTAEGESLIKANSKGASNETTWRYTTFVNLDVLGHMDALQEEFDAVLWSHSGGYVVNQELELFVQHLNDTVKSWFAAFIRHVRSDGDKTVPVDATVHQHTANTLAYITALLAYEDLVRSRLSDSSLGRFVSNVAEALVENMREKNIKKDHVRYVFLINNLDFIMRSLSESVIGPEVDPETVSSINQSLSLLREAYMKSTWSKALGYLVPLESRPDPSRKLTNSEKSALKKQFTGFNSCLEDVFAAHSLLSVPVPALKEFLREENRQTVLPLYGEFLRRYGELTFSTNRNKYVKYDVETVRDMIGRFYGDS